MSNACPRERAICWAMRRTSSGAGLEVLAEVDDSDAGSRSVVVRGLWRRDDTVDGAGRGILYGSGGAARSWCRYRIQWLASLTRAASMGAGGMGRMDGVGSSRNI